jgi:hypothetical protein
MTWRAGPAAAAAVTIVAANVAIAARFHRILIGLLPACTCANLVRNT